MISFNPYTTTQINHTKHTMTITLDNFEPKELIPADQVPWPHPDYTDLNDWLFEQATEVFEATRYLAVSKYDLALSLWHHAGRPTDGFECALWTKEEALG